MRRFLFIALVSTVFLSACGSSGGGTQDNVQAVSSSTPSSASSSSVSSSVVSSSVVSSSSSAQPERFPNYNTSPQAGDMTGMEKAAADIAADLSIGLNIGNTLEAYGAQSETYWGNPAISPEFIAYVKQQGFNAVRLPVSWDQYADADSAAISDAWLARVKEVVQYCIDNDLYVIVNIHWDGGWLEENVTAEHAEENNARQKAYWQQIATQLRNFDHRVLFASANEPNVDTAEQMAVLETYHQTFVDTVRATGGKNAYRTLVIQGPRTDIEKTHELMSALPTDTVEGRLMAEVHFYSPWNYTGMQQDEDWGNQFFYWGEGFHSTTDTAHNPTWGEEAFVDEMFALMKAQFVDQGVPVILGEFGTGIRTHLEGDDLQLHLDGRAYYFRYITSQALRHGLLPFYWDIGQLLDRRDLNVLEPQAYQALIEAGTDTPNFWAQ